MTHPRIAFIGCGAVAESFHMPALEATGRSPALLVDPSPERRAAVASGRNCPAVARHDDHLDSFDAAILSVPHALHAPLSIALLEQAKHVLVEKPMAMTAAECEAMLAAAERGGVTLTVGLIRRYRHLHRWVKAVIDAGELGDIESFEFVEGFAYDWRVTTDSFWSRAKSGGGVLMDSGAHTLDLLTWWLGPAADVRYRDDDRGGVEADCLLELTLASGATGTVELSRTRNLGGSAVIRGTRGAIAIDLFAAELKAEPAALLEFRDRGRKPKALPPQNNKDLFAAQMAHWLEVLGSGATPICDGRSASVSVGLIEQCYRNRENWTFAWDVERVG